MWQTIIWRLARTAAAMALAGGAAYVSGNPHLVWLAPIIAALGKALRDGTGLTNIPI